MNRFLFFLIFLFSGITTLLCQNLKYGDAYIITNGYPDWTRDLIICGPPVGCQSGNLVGGVNTSTRSRNKPESSWVLASASGKQYGETVMDGDKVFIQSQGNGGYLDLCGDMTGSCDVYLGYVNTTRTKVTPWMIAALESGPITVGEMVQFKQVYDKSEGWLGTCSSGCESTGNIAGIYPKRDECNDKTTHWRLSALYTGPPEHVRITKVQCLKPAVGIETQAVDASNYITGLANDGLTVAGAVSIVLPQIGAVVTVAGAAVLGVDIATWTAEQIDKDRAPDNLYIRVNGRKVWPDPKYVDAKGGQIFTTNIVIGPHDHLELWEWDIDSIFDDDTHDSLGSVQLNINQKGDDFILILQNREEDSLYQITFNAY